MKGGASFTEERGSHALIVVLPASSLFDYLMGRRTLSRVPADALCTSVWIDGDPERPGVGTGWGAVGRNCIALRLEHPSFPWVPLGGKMKRIKARFRRLTH